MGSGKTYICLQFIRPMFGSWVKKKNSYHINFHLRTSGHPFVFSCLCSNVCYSWYLHWGQRSPPCPCRSKAMVQESTDLPSASFHSWTPGVWEPEVESSWPGSGSSSTRNGMLMGDVGKQEARFNNRKRDVTNSVGDFDLTKIFKFFFQSHAVMRETLLADQSISATMFQKI